MYVFFQDSDDTEEMNFSTYEGISIASKFVKFFVKLFEKALNASSEEFMIIKKSCVTSPRADNPLCVLMNKFFDTDSLFAMLPNTKKYGEWMYAGILKVITTANHLRPLIENFAHSRHWNCISHSVRNEYYSKVKANNVNVTVKDLMCRKPVLAKDRAMHTAVVQQE